MKILFFSSFIIIATFCAKNGAKSQNVVLNKLHFCKEWHFLSNFGQNFEKISTSRFFCDYICLHLCDNFGIFNINVEGFIGKNNEKITKNDPSLSYIKVKTPKNESVIPSERS